MIRSFVVAAAALACASSLHAQSARADSAAVVAVIEQYHAALAAGDSARAVALLADDMIVLESGALETRAEYLAHHLAADMKASQSSRGLRTIVRVTVIGDVAYVVSKTVTPPTGAQGNAGSEMAELMVVAKSAGVWKLRAVHWSSRRIRP